MDPLLGAFMGGTFFGVVVVITVLVVLFHISREL